MLLTRLKVATLLLLAVLGCGSVLMQGGTTARQPDPVIKLKRLPAAQQDKPAPKQAENRQRLDAALATLKGTWRVVYVETTDRFLPEQVAGDCVWDIADGKITRTFTNTKDGTREDVVRFTIDPTRSPAHLDVVTQTAGKRTVLQGIYKQDGDELTVCLIGADGGRPVAFSSNNRGDRKGGNMLLKLKRQKPAPNE